MNDDPYHDWSRNTKHLSPCDDAEAIRPRPVPIAIRLPRSLPQVSKITKYQRLRLATSVLRGLRRTQDEITGAVDAVEAGPAVEKECPAQRKDAYESGQACYDESIWMASGPEKWWRMLSRKSWHSCADSKSTMEFLGVR